MSIKILFILLLLAATAKGQNEVLVEKAECGDVEAQLALGNYFYDAQDYTSAVYWYKELAGYVSDSKDPWNGIPEAQYKLGMCYYTGKGIEQNFFDAVKWFKNAAGAYRGGVDGVPKAQYYLAKCYYNGKGIKKNLGRAYFWYKKAANQNHKKAAEMLNKYEQFDADQCYNVARGFEDVYDKDYHYARMWYEKAIAKGHKSAKEALKKLSLEKNEYHLRYDFALEDGAKKGVKSDMYAYAVCFMGYGKNVYHDPDEAIKWLTELAKLPYENYHFVSCYTEEHGAKNKEAVCAAWSRLAYYYFDRNDYDEAIKWYKKIFLSSKNMQNNNDFYDLIRRIGLCYSRSKTYSAEGIEFIQNNYPKYIDYFNKEGKDVSLIRDEYICALTDCYINSGQYNKAIDLLLSYEKGLDRQLYLSNTWMRFAHCYEAKGDYAKAIEYYEKLSYFESIVKCYEKQKEYSKAKECIIQEMNHYDKPLDENSGLYKYYIRELRRLSALEKYANRSNHNTQTANPVDLVRQYFVALNKWLSVKDYVAGLDVLMGYYVSDTQKNCRMEDIIAKDLIKTKGYTLSNVMPESYLYYLFTKKRESALKADVLDIHQDGSSVYAKVKYTGNINKVTECYFTVQDNGIVYISSNKR